METVKIKLLRENAKLPNRVTAGSVGYDIYACISEPTTVSPGETQIIPSGFGMALDKGYAAFIYARSGLGIKNNIVPANCVGVIDSDYRGEILVGLINNSNIEYTIQPLDRIAQMVITKCELPELIKCNELDESDRNDKGMGSTGTGD